MARLKDHDTIFVQQRSHYGRQRIYPVGEPAETLCALTGKKTLSMMELRLISRLGYMIEYVPSTIDPNQYQIGGNYE